MIVDLVDLELTAELERVCLNHPGKAIAEIDGVVYLDYVGDRNSHDEGRKGDVLGAFVLRRLHIDT